MTKDEAIRKYLRYEPTTGDLWWTAKAPVKVANKKANAKDPLGYICLKINGHMLKGHRLAWFFVYGDFPKAHIDHINGNPSDNRIENLRDVSRFINMQNEKKARFHNSSGFLGVSPNGSGWRAEIRILGKKKNLGTFATPQQAHEAYVYAKRQYHEGCTL
jgi:hypothetical protein